MFVLSDNGKGTVFIPGNEYAEGWGRGTGIGDAIPEGAAENWKNPEGMGPGLAPW